MRNLGLHVIQYPTGRWGYVGSVPHALAYMRPDGSTPTPAEVDEDLRLPGNVRKLRAQSYSCRADAIEVATLYGYEVAR